MPEANRAAAEHSAMMELSGSLSEGCAHCLRLEGSPARSVGGILSELLSEGAHNPSIMKLPASHEHIGAITGNCSRQAAETT